MSILIRDVDMPACCADCFAYVGTGIFPYCRVLHSDCRTYTFDKNESRMPSCPLADAEDGKPETDYKQLDERLKKVEKVTELLIQHCPEIDFVELMRKEKRNRG